MSATGLLPWYAGRNNGFAGLGVRSVYLRKSEKRLKRQKVDRRDCSVTLHAVEEHIEARTNLNFTGAALGVVSVLQTDI